MGWFVKDSKKRVGEKARGTSSGSLVYNIFSVVFSSYVGDVVRYYYGYYQQKSG